MSLLSYTFLPFHRFLNRVYYVDYYILTSLFSLYIMYIFRIILSIHKLTPMSYDVVPHINTLIFNFGRKYVQIGYTGDFQPIYVFDTSSANEEIIVGSEIVNIEKLCRIISKSCEEHCVDTAIIVLDHCISKESENILKENMKNIKHLRSFLFMRNSVCHAFGNGKTTGSVVCCEAGVGSVFIIEKGEVVESFSTNIPQEEIECEDDNINEITELIDKMIVMREKRKIKKNLINGAIIFAGHLFKNKELQRKYREYILNKYGNSFSELVITNNHLDSCFTGASIFGMNNESKLLFTSNNTSNQ